MFGKAIHLFQRVVQVPLLVSISGITVLLCDDHASAGDPQVGRRIVTYAQDIRPLLDKHCVECHSGWFPDGGLRLDTIDAIYKGGNSGPAIVPGAPQKGWLTYSLTNTGQRGMQMPPDGEQLSQQQVELLKQWIEQGAR